MQSKDVQQMFIEVIEHARTQPHLQYNTITSHDDYYQMCGKRRFLRLLLKSLKSGGTKLFNSYCSSVVRGNSDVNKLIVFSQLQKVYNYYEIELQTVTKMISDYKIYFDFT